MGRLGERVVGGVVHRTLEQAVVLQGRRDVGNERLGQPGVVVAEARGVAQPVTHLQDAHDLLAARQRNLDRFPHVLLLQQGVVAVPRA